ncbi:hypothetical protein EDB83DRAFT_2275918 [Lactarius deliciosus]|nr:hypothetical protein EDB83DRAFT_2275918 [Lactarius deliciosus]
MIYLLVLLLSLVPCLVQYGRSQQTLFPAAIPLAVRSPYLSCWQFTTNGTTIGSLWPTTSAHQPNPGQDPSLDSLNTVVLVRVDNITYLFLGFANTINATVNLTSTVISPTQTKLTAEAGPMQVNLTFLNPIEPGDWVKQSIPFSYLSLTAKSLDGAAHAVQVYSYPGPEWMSADRNQVIVWTTTTNSNAVYHSVRLQNPAVFNEIATQQEWGTLHYAMKSGGKITYNIAGVTDALELFQLQGVLDNHTDVNFRPINDSWPVFGVSRDLGTIQATPDPVVWTIGFITDPVINYTDLSGASQQRSLFYKTQYPDDTSLIVDFLNDFANASSRAQQLDQKILQDSAAVSGLLGDLVSLATAQVYGSTHLTIGADAAGNFNKSDVMAFMKNIGGSQRNRVNAVETLYSAFPAFMYIDPGLGGLFLEPLFRLQASPNYTSPYAAADLGSEYPNVTVGNPNHDQGVEQSGNMLIMTYAYARASGDGSLISRYYSLLTSWADYLSNSTLLIHDQSSADELSTNNQTNLAIKGIIAIKAMSIMSSIIKQAADVDKYSSAAANLYTQWKSLALASDQHLLATYGRADSWTLGYNLFADVWLGTGVVESSVYSSQSSFVDNLTLTSTFSNFGMPVDSLGLDPSVAVSSWNLFVAAMTPNQDLRTVLISRIHNRASYNASAGVFPLNYDSTSGAAILGRASPAQGAMYAPLALKAPVVQITTNLTTTGTSSKSHTGAVAAGVTGGVVALLAIGAIALVVWRRRSRRRQSHRRESAGDASLGGVTNPSPQITVTPFSQMGQTLTGAAPLDPRSQTEQQVDGPSPSEGSPLLLPRGSPVPVGLSSKELARLRSRSPPTDGRSPNLSQVILTHRGAATPSSLGEDQGLLWQSEVASLRGEMQQLRTEIFEAPPSYSSEVRPS